MFTTEEISEIVTSQLDSLLWSEGEIYDENGEPTLENWDEIYSADDATPELIAQLTAELQGVGYSEEFAHALKVYAKHFGESWPEQFGHDLALTRNGHGAGFWDRGINPDAGDVLTDWAQSLGTLHIFHGEGSIYPEWVGMFHAE